MKRQPLNMPVAQYLRATEEHTLQMAVLQHLRIAARPGVFAFSIPNAGKRSPQQASRMKREGMMAGVADLCVMMDEGRTGWLELKSDKGKQKEAQREFETLCAFLSHNYAVCRNLYEAIDILRTWGATR